MINTIDVELYVKRHSAFDLKRIARAQKQGFAIPVTAYLCGVFIYARSAVGVVFDHQRQDSYGRFADGHLIRTSDVVGVRRDGRFWVLTTINSRYVIATFQRDNGRASLREFLRLADGQHDLSPHSSQ